MPDGIDDPRRVRLKLEGCSASSGGKDETSMLSSAERPAVVIESAVEAIEVIVVVDVGVFERMELIISD